MAAYGSPPRAWGKGRLLPESVQPSGITPACAGKSGHRARWHRPRRDHPRVRGEKPELLVLIPVLYGSPPRARGKEQQKTLASEMKGITPACAGKSAQGPCLTDKNKDHPRVRGEKKVILQPEHLRTGSPPRARGKVQQLHPAVRDMGITPACAGKSRWKICPGVKWWDHPRVRGEKSTVYSMGRPGMGSPPRARGKALVVLQAGQHAGITPACAGKSKTRSF